MWARAKHSLEKIVTLRRLRNSMESSFLLYPQMVIPSHKEWTLPRARSEGLTRVLELERHCSCCPESCLVKRLKDRGGLEEPAVTRGDGNMLGTDWGSVWLWVILRKLPRKEVRWESSQTGNDPSDQTPVGRSSWGQDGGKVKTGPWRQPCTDQDAVWGLCSDRISKSLQKHPLGRKST